MKVIDEIIKCSKREHLLRKAKLEDGTIYEYNGTPIVGQIIKKYGMCPEILNAKLEPIEDEFIDIEEINNAYYHENQDRTNHTSKNAINDLIKNQKAIINKLKEMK